MRTICSLFRHQTCTSQALLHLCNAAADSLKFMGASDLALALTAMADLGIEVSTVTSIASIVVHSLPEMSPAGVVGIITAFKLHARLDYPDELLIDHMVKHLCRKRLFGVRGVSVVVDFLSLAVTLCATSPEWRYYILCIMMSLRKEPTFSQSDTDTPLATNVAIRLLELLPVLWTEWCTVWGELLASGHTIVPLQLPAYLTSFLITVLFSCPSNCVAQLAKLPHATQWIEADLLPTYAVAIQRAVSMNTSVANVTNLALLHLALDIVGPSDTFNVLLRRARTEWQSVMHSAPCLVSTLRELRELGVLSGRFVHVDDLVVVTSQRNLRTISEILFCLASLLRCQTSHDILESTLHFATVACKECKVEGIDTIMIKEFFYAMSKLFSTLESTVCHTLQQNLTDAMSELVERIVSSIDSIVVVSQLDKLHAAQLLTDKCLYNIFIVLDAQKRERRNIHSMIITMSEIIVSRMRFCEQDSELVAHIVRRGLVVSRQNCQEWDILRLRSPLLTFWKSPGFIVALANTLQDLSLNEVMFAFSCITASDTITVNLLRRFTLYINAHVLELGGPHSELSLSDQAVKHARWEPKKQSTLCYRYRTRTRGDEIGVIQSEHFFLPSQICELGQMLAKCVRLLDTIARAEMDMLRIDVSWITLITKLEKYSGFEQFVGRDGHFPAHAAFEINDINVNELVSLC